MSLYILYGSNSLNIDDAKICVEGVFNFKMIPHESSYLGAYYKFGKKGDLNFLLTLNSNDHDLAEPDFRDSSTLFYVNNLNSSLYLQNMIKGKTKFLEHFHELRVEELD